METADDRRTPLVLTSAHGDGSLRAAVEAGELRRLRRGAYVRTRPGSAPSDLATEQARDHRARCAAVASVLSCRFAFSHTTAAFLLGLPAPVEHVVHVTQTSSATQERAADVRRHRRRDIPEHDVVLLRAFPATVGRTLSPRTDLRGGFRRERG